MSISESSPLANRMLPFDGMRGIAAVGVAAFHVNPASPFLFWAWTFVDMFFVLSGFLIGSILYRGISEGTLSLKNFWMRRILRIWPLYYLTLAIVLLGALLVSKRGIPVGDLVQSLFFLQFTENYLLGANWAGTINDYIPWFAHSWSIATEEQFYVLLPALLWLFGVRARSIFLITIVAIATSQFLLHADFAPGLLGTRMQGLALGLLLVPLSQWLNAASTDFVPQRRRLALGIIAGGFALGSYIMVPVFMQVVPVHWNGATIDPEAGKAVVHASILGMALVYFGIAGFVIAFPGGVAARTLSTPALVYLGSISYAVYMFHVPIEGIFIKATGHALATNGLMVKTAYWIAILGAAHLSKIFIENRFNALKHRYPVYRTSA